MQKISYKERLELQQLFESCGAFYAERKALMVSRLEQEYHSLTENVDYLQILDGENSNVYSVSEWKRLLEMEQKRSEYLTEQVGIQQSIITEFIDGGSVRTAEVVGFVADAQGISELLEVLNKQITVVRNNLFE